MEDKNSDIISRIKYLIQLKRISQAEFARRINIDPSNLCKHLTSKLPITDVLINRIVVEMGVSKQWLKYGDDVPYSKVAGQSVEVLDVEKLSVVKLPGIPDYDIDTFTIKQFRRHNRQLIHRQTERTYKLDGKIVAKNRRKRIGQTENSLHEWYIEMKQKWLKLKELHI